MAMKKRFLPALMAGMVVVGSTGLVNAYAQTETVTGNDTETLQSNVSVSGFVTDENGISPEGKLTVEVPTKMAFSVDQEGNLIGTNYTIKNKSKDAVDVYVSEFRRTKGDINVVEDIGDDATRADVMLELTGNLDPVNLADQRLNGSGDGIQVANIEGNNTRSITLDGEAGHEKNPKVDSEGATGEFNMVFKIKKSSSN